jgi:hypothetical protein
MTPNALAYRQWFPKLAWIWRPKMANGKALDKPIVTVGSSGVSRVEPADILRSKVGQAEISKAAAVAIALNLREPQTSRTSQGS